MKTPSRNISKSLRSQSAPGRGPIATDISRLKAYGPSMIAPGEGGVERPPGAGAPGDERQSRSAATYADALVSKLGR